MTQLGFGGAAQGNVAAEYPGSEEGNISVGMMNAWLNFVYYLDPNGDDGALPHFARPLLLTDELGNVLQYRTGPPTPTIRADSSCALIRGAQR